MALAILQGSIRRKLAILFLLAALPALVLLVLIGVQNRDKLVREAEQDLLAFAQQAAQNQERTTLATRQLLMSLAQMPEVQRADPDACSQILAHVLQVNPLYAALHLVDTKGQLIASGRAATGNSFAGVKHFRDALANKDFATGEYILSVSLRVPVFAFGYPVMDWEGNVRAVLLISISLDSYGSLFEQMRFPKDSFFGVCDEQGLRLYRFPARPEVPLGKPIQANNLAASSGDEVEGLVADIGTDGVERLVAFRQLRLGPNHPPYMKMFVGIPHAAVNMAARASLLHDLGVLVLAIALTLLSGWYLGGKALGRRLEELATASRRIGEGDFNVRVAQEHEITEVATLSKAFNSMAESLAQDITARALAEEALRESELRFKALHNASFGGITIHDQGIILDCNQGLSAITGYDYDQLIGMNGLLLIAEQSRELVMGHILAGYEKPYEVLGVRKNGQVYPVRLEARNIPYKGKNVRVVEFRDITEIKQSEEALRLEAQRRRILMEKSYDGIATIDREHRVAEANERFAAMLGYSREEVLGLHTWDFEARLTEEQIRSEFADLPDVGSVLESQHRRKDGSVIDVEVSVSGALVGGEPLVFAICRDITERKRIQEQTRQTSEFLNSLITYANAPIIVWDTSYKISKFNRAFERLTGLAAEQVLGRSLALLFPQEQKVSTMDYIRRTSSAGERWETVEIPIQHTDGSIRTVLWNSASILDHDGGGIVATIAQGQDITERKRAEEELHKAKDLAEAANRAKSEFLANMSHEIRTPLNGVLGMLQLIRSSGVSGDVESFTEMALRAGKRLTALLGDILDLSRIEAGRMPIVRHPFALDDVISALAETFSPTHFSKRLSFVVNLDSQVPSQFLGDEVRIRQVLFNLIGNAMKFTDQGEVRLDIWRLPAHPSGAERILFIISDTGLGIPDDKLGQVCDPFIQVSQDFTRSHQGAGLGLAITQRLVAAMGGTLTFESAQGLGTNVFLMLPLGVPPLSALPQSPAQAVGFGPKTALRVLLVEDEEISRLSARVLLTRLGHSVQTATQGRDALEILRVERFDCVLMDVQMDVMDGVEATRRLREGQAGPLNQNVPIIALTAYAMAGDREKFLEAGMNDHVAKPVHVEELVRTLERIARAPLADVAPSDLS